MTRRKHDELTTDDLLKLQEGPPSKKIRVSTSASVDSGYFAGINDSDSGSIASSSPGDDSTDRGEDSQEDADSFLGQVDEEQAENDHLELRGAMEDSGRLKMSRTNQISTRTRGLAQTSMHSIKSFNDIGISSALEAALHRMSIYTPTEVQSACIPPILAGPSWWSEDSTLEHFINVSFL